MDWSILATALPLSLVAFAAGFFDAVVGGGGLLQLPSIFIFLPNSAPLTALGTNRFSSITGTTVSALAFIRMVKLPWATIIPISLLAAIGASSGAYCLSLVDPEIVKPLILVALILIAIYTWQRKTLGHVTGQPLASCAILLPVAITIVGFYDGFIGPGAGSFYVLALVGIRGWNFLLSSASAKVLNVASNLAGFLYFTYYGHVNYSVAIPMALCNAAGGIVGARMTVLKGSTFVRKIFLGLIFVIILRFAWDLKVIYP